jgi:hypothetical protein
METGVLSAASDAVKDYIAHLENENRQLKESIADKEQAIIQFTQQIRNLESEKGLLQEKLRLALFRQFGKGAEKFSGAGQLPLFDGGETGAIPQAEKPFETETIEYTRRKGGSYYRHSGRGKEVRLRKPPDMYWRGHR